ncbi:MAG TPA: SMI1/KNR4 family protein [Kofleriaceae bacterium]|nr:SMI1/KNR4 family protein [Kofleriaceae bacterium]
MDIYEQYASRTEKLLAAAGPERMRQAKALARDINRICSSRRAAKSVDIVLLASGILSDVVQNAPRPVATCLAPVLMKGIGEHPGNNVLSSDLPVAERLGPVAIPWLVDMFDGALAKAITSTYDDPLVSSGGTLAWTTLDLLTQFEGAVLDRVVRELARIAWDDARLSMLARILRHRVAEDARISKVWSRTKWAREKLRRRTKATAAQGRIGVAVEAKTRGQPGKGHRDLEAALFTLGFSKKKPASVLVLPRTLPTDIEGALGLIDKWKLGDALPLGAPARDSELAKLTRGLGFALPADLRNLLSRHGSVGRREVGPIDRMLRERRELLSDAPSLGKLTVLGTDGGGNQFVLGPQTKSGASSPILLIRHDEARPVPQRVAQSLGEFVALLATMAYANREGLAAEFKTRYGKRFRA